MIMQNFNDAETIVSLAVMTQSRAMPKTDKITISPMRLCAMQAAVRANAWQAAVPQMPLSTTMQNVFMTTTTWFHAHLETPMGPQVASALQRIHDAGQGLFVGHNVLFVSLRQIATSPAGYDASVGRAAQMAEQALLSRIMQ